MKRVLSFVVAGLLPAVAFAQGAPQKITMASGLQYQYDSLKRNLKDAAEKMPQADYGFKPRPDMEKSFGQLFGHIANAQFQSCAALKGEPNPNKGNDAEKKTTKAEFIKDLNDSFAYCDGAFAAATDGTLTQLVKTSVHFYDEAAGIGRHQLKVKNPQSEVARGYIMIDLVRHDWSALSSAGMYLRMKGLVPPHIR